QSCRPRCCATIWAWHWRQPRSSRRWPRTCSSARASGPPAARLRSATTSPSEYPARTWPSGRPVGHVATGLAGTCRLAGRARDRGQDGKCGPSAGTATAAGRATAPRPCERGSAMNASPTPAISFDVHASERRVPDEVRANLLESPGFGQVFTDHMITLRWSTEEGWHDGKLEPYGPLVLDPATAVLHYSQEIFEGLKAYRQDGGPIVAFRPYANAARFRRSAARMAMPELPDDAFVHAIELLVSHDKDWCPCVAEQSLYLRPFMVATGVGLGVGRPAGSYIFLVIASPSGSVFGGGGLRSV